MIIFVDVKNGKVDLTKQQFERILKEKYNEGYNDGKKITPISTWGCPYSSWSCPYKPYNPYNQPNITWCGSVGTATATTATTTTSASNMPSKSTDKITLTSSNMGDIATSGYVDASDGIQINYHEVT